VWPSESWNGFGNKGMRRRICGRKISSECPDLDIFGKAAAERRILLTFDLDFGEIVALSGEKDVSVVLFRLHNTRTPHVIERLKIALQETAPILRSGAIVVVEETRLRVRRLPLRS
jgi:predicted nuclease of predicted toxin-antitoxin system